MSGFIMVGPPKIGHDFCQHLVPVSGNNVHCPIRNVSSTLLTLLGTCSARIWPTNRCFPRGSTKKSSLAQYSKCFVPLESDPTVFSDLLSELGASDALTFTDVWSIDDPLQLDLIPRPVLALILVLPTCEEYERHRQIKKSVYTANDITNLVWFRQTIDNACGLYAVLHAACNVRASEFLRKSLPRILMFSLLMCYRTEHLVKQTHLPNASSAKFAARNLPRS